MAAAKKTKTATATETKPRKKRAYKKRAPAATKPEPEAYAVLSLRIPSTMKADFQAKCDGDHRTMSQQVAFLVDTYTNPPETRA